MTAQARTGTDAPEALRDLAEKSAAHAKENLETMTVAAEAPVVVRPFWVALWGSAKKMTKIVRMQAATSFSTNKGLVMTDPIKCEDTTWDAVRRDGFYIMAPMEFASRKLLFLYQSNAWVRVSLALLGAVAIVSTILSLSQWKHDREIQKLNFFVQIKESAGGIAVAAVYKSLLSDGIPPDQVPVAKANLSQADLSQMDISKAYFKEADLTRTKFRQSTLVEATFRDSHLGSADFTGAQLDKADFIGAQAANINLSKSRLDKADFGVAFMFGANLEDATAKNADFRMSLLERANLKKIDATAATFSAANLHSANLTNARLVNADLSGADLSDAILNGANISGAKFELRNQAGEIQKDDHDRPLVAKVSPMQIQVACADPTNPPHLPSTDEFKGLVAPDCK
jgi:uncharacterized protein YjbI with pentapeptide repeats